MHDTSLDIFNLARFFFPGAAIIDGAGNAGRMIEISRLIPPASRPFADLDKLARQGAFNWSKYTPIIVEQSGNDFYLMDGMTRVENARRAGITSLPAYIYPR